MSIRCFRSLLIIDAQTSSLFAQESSGRGQFRAIFASDGPFVDSTRTVGARELDASEGDAFRWEKLVSQVQSNLLY